jgi:hypothetical protein
VQPWSAPVLSALCDFHCTNNYTHTSFEANITKHTQESKLKFIVVQDAAQECFSPRVVAAQRTLHRHSWTKVHPGFTVQDKVEGAIMFTISFFPLKLNATKNNSWTLISSFLCKRIPSSGLSEMQAPLPCVRSPSRMICVLQPTIILQLVACVTNSLVAVSYGSTRASCSLRNVTEA